MNWKDAPIGKFWWLVGYNQAQADISMGHGNYRAGQNTFNVLFQVRPDLAERIRGSQLDAFHVDSGSKLTAMCEWIEGNW